MARAWFPFYFADYSAKTEHLTLIEHGAYLMLIGNYYKTGCKLPANAMQLQRICRAFDPAEIQAMQNVLDQFFVKQDNHYLHERIEAELKKSNDISEKRSKAAQKRYKNDANYLQKTCKSNAIAGDLPPLLHTQSQSHITTTNTEDRNTSPEQKNCSEPAVIELTLNTGVEYPITQTMVDKWQALYPAVNILQALRNMCGWLSANPKKRKTKAGVLRFVNTWLAKEQDRGGQTNATNQQDSRSRSQRVSDKVREIGERDIEENGFAETLD